MSTNHADVQARLRTVFLDCLSEPPEIENLGAETPIVKKGLALDSIALLELVIGIENEFDVILDEGSLSPEHFASFDKLTEFVAAKLAASPEEKDSEEKEAT